MILLASIYIYCIAAIFKLLDTSAGILINHGISVTPFYLERKVVKAHLAKIEDESLRKKLRFTLFCQLMHKVFTVLAILTAIAGIISEFLNPSLILIF